MKTALFITIGTRDIAITKDIDSDLELKSKLNLTSLKGEYYWLNQPKMDGEKIFRNYSEYETYLDFPIVLPAIEEIIEMVDSKKIDNIFLIFTDQERAVSPVSINFTEKDSVNFAKIIEKKLRDGFTNQIGKIKKIPIVDDVIFYDYMYDFFGKVFKEDKVIQSLRKEDAKVFVLPQGGIVSINTTLLLTLRTPFLKNQKKAKEY